MSIVNLYQQPDKQNNVYSEEEVRIGTWIDGKPVYQITVVTETGPIKTWTQVVHIDKLETIISINGYIISTDVGAQMIPGASAYVVDHPNFGPAIYPLFESISKRPCYITIKYTKTTD